MARTIKRLIDRSDSSYVSVARRIQREPRRWEEALEWWRRVGIDTGVLLTLLESARVERNQYEGRLRARVDPLAMREIRDVRRALKRAEPLIRLFKTTAAVDFSTAAASTAPSAPLPASLLRLLRTHPGYSAPRDPSSLFFGDLGEQIERSVETYIDTLHPALSAHRPFDPWLRKAVLALAHLLLARKQSLRRTIREIDGILKLAGHGDVVTGEKIRHILRKQRR